MGKWRLRGRDGAEGADIIGFIGEGTVFTGELAFKGGARVDGRVVGRITAPSLLIVGPNGEIEAEELKAFRVTVCGTVRGNLTVEDRLEVQAGGRVSGHVVMEKQGLVVAPGGIFEGTIEYAHDTAAEPASTREFAIEGAV